MNDAEREARRRYARWWDRVVMSRPEMIPGVWGTPTREAAACEMSKRFEGLGWEPEHAAGRMVWRVR